MLGYLLQHTYKGNVYATDIHCCYFFAFLGFNLVCFPLWKGCMNATLIKHVKLGAGGQVFTFFSAIWKVFLLYPGLSIKTKIANMNVCFVVSLWERNWKAGFVRSVPAAVWICFYVETQMYPWIRLRSWN